MCAALAAATILTWSYVSRLTSHVSRRIWQRYVSALLGEKLAADKPPWELRVVFQSAEADCSSTDTVLILRIHRCLADGMTLVKVLCTKLVDTTATCTAFKVGSLFAKTKPFSFRPKRLVAVRRSPFALRVSLLGLLVFSRTVRLLPSVTVSLRQTRR